MNLSPEFLAAVSNLQSQTDRLLAVAPQRIAAGLRGSEVGGIYLFSENGKHLYVGRTKRRISSRVRDHVANRDDCPFAFRLAREVTGFIKASYGGEDVRAALLARPEFVSAYAAAKARIRNMDIRWISEPDPLKQTLLEVYVAVTLKTPYNDLDTH
jgi:hypothetical protein